MMAAGNKSATLAFNAASPRNVIFGAGRLREIGPVAAAYGNRCLVFCGSDAGRAEPLLNSLRETGCAVDVLSVLGEPTFDLVRAYAESAASFKPDAVAAIGGGSVIDTAKAVAMLLGNGGDPLDYAEVIGGGQPVNKPSVPFIAIPTTAGAGAEATKNAVLVEPSKKAKVSLRSPLMIPETVLLDPELSLSLPPAVTAATGMDALSQLIESFVTVKANPFTDALCRAGIPRAVRSLRRACEHGDDLQAREDMCLAAWWSGMALANSGLGAVHGFAAALGGMCLAPHGLICSVLLAPVCRVNVESFMETNAERGLERYRELAVMLTGDPGAGALDAAPWLRDLAASLPLKRLAEFGAAELDPADVADAAIRSSSMKGNPVKLNAETVAEIFTSALNQ